MNSKFYDSIAPYYNEIFPLSKQKIRALTLYIKKHHPKAQMLDIACATGEFACNISSYVNSIEAFDLDPNMISIANKNKSALHENVNFQVGDMLKLNSMYKQSFDIITCFGNSLVHLNNSSLHNVFSQIYKLLNPGGSFIGQIVNYDYIYNEKINTLPLIDNEIIRFERNYSLIDENKLVFHTRLQIKHNERVVESSIPLYPIKKLDLVRLLKKSGFQNIEVYKNYKFEIDDGNQIPLIFIANKGKAK